MGRKAEWVSIFIYPITKLPIYQISFVLRVSKVLLWPR
jgi:hypothetical protein